MSVVVAHLTREITYAEFHQCLNQLLIHDRTGPGHIVDDFRMVSGTRIASSRNDVVRGFLVHPDHPDWLLFLDDDMVFQPTLLDDLLAAADPEERPIVGALCFTGGMTGRVRPTMLVTVSADPLVLDTVWNYEPNALNGVDATGAAAILIHRRVLETLDERHSERVNRWFAEMESEIGEFGEDAVFCLRARAAGFPVYVHTGIKVGHLKLQVIDEDSYLVYRRGITAMGEDGYRERELARRGKGS